MTICSPAFSPFSTMKSSPMRRAQLHFAGLDVTIAAIDKSNLASAGLQNASRRDHELASHRDFQRHIHEHAGFELEPRVGKDNADLGRSRIRVHLRVNEIHATAEGSARKSVHGERCRIADFDSSKVVLKNLRLNPNRRKIGNGVEAHIGLDRNTGKSIAFGDVAGNRRIDFQFLLHLSSGFQSGDFLFAERPIV